MISPFKIGLKSPNPRMACPVMWCILWRKIITLWLSVNPRVTQMCKGPQLTTPAHRNWNCKNNLVGSLIIMVTVIVLNLDGTPFIEYSMVSCHNWWELNQSTNLEAKLQDYHESYKLSYCSLLTCYKNTKPTAELLTSSIIYIWKTIFSTISFLWRSLQFKCKIVPTYAS